MITGTEAEDRITPTTCTAHPLAGAIRKAIWEMAKFQFTLINGVHKSAKRPKRWRMFVHHYIP